MNKVKHINVVNEQDEVIKHLPIGVDAINVDLEDGQNAEEVFVDLQDKIKKKPYYFDNVEKMKSANLKEGDCCITLGYYEVNDSGGATYLIRKKLQNDINDAGSIHVINNDLVAELNIENSVNIKQFGARGDGITEDTKYIQKTIDYANNKGLKILIPEGIFLTGSLTLYNRTNIEGLNRQKSIFKLKAGLDIDFISLTDITKKNICLQNFTIDGNKKNNTCPNAIFSKQNTDTHHLFRDLIIYRVYGNGINIGRGEIRADNIYIHHCDGYGFINSGSDNIFTNLSCAWNYLGGIREGGASTRWSKCKAYVNGECDNILKTEHNENAYGFRISDSYGSQFVECDAQENYSHGFYISSYDNASLISCNSDNNGMINKFIDGEENYKKKYGFVFTNSKNCKLIGFVNNFRYPTLGVHWQYGGLGFADKNNVDCELNITAMNQIENIVYNDWEIYTTMITNNKIVDNTVDWQSKILGGIIIDKDRLNTCRVDFGDTKNETENAYRLLKTTDGGFRLRNYLNNELLGDIIQVNKNNGLILGSNLLGFYGTIPVSKATLKENATDLNTAIALVNDIKTKLIRMGLVN